MHAWPHFFTFGASIPIPGLDASSSRCRILEVRGALPCDAGPGTNRALPSCAAGTSVPAKLGSLPS